jgi:hypothetical protein
LLAVLFVYGSRGVPSVRVAPVLLHCTGEYGNPDACKPSAYSQLFKKACPRAFSYAYDGADSIFTCGGGSNTCTYTITFYPAPARPGIHYIRPPLGF